MTPCSEWKCPLMQPIDYTRISRKLKLMLLIESIDDEPPSQTILDDPDICRWYKDGDTFTTECLDRYVPDAPVDTPEQDGIENCEFCGKRVMFCGPDEPQNVDGNQYQEENDSDRQQ